MQNPLPETMPDAHFHGQSHGVMYGIFRLLYKEWTVQSPCWIQTRLCKVWRMLLFYPLPVLLSRNVSCCGEYTSLLTSRWIQQTAQLSGLNRSGPSLFVLPQTVYVNVIESSDPAGFYFLPSGFQDLVPIHQFWHRWLEIPESSKEAAAAVWLFQPALFQKSANLHLLQQDCWACKVLQYLHHIYSSCHLGPDNS